MDSWIYKVFKECRSSRFIAPTANTIGFLKHTPVSLLLVTFWYTNNLIFNVLGFNQIDLPQYTTYEMLRQQLLMAINEGGEGFAFS